MSEKWGKLTDDDLSAYGVVAVFVRGPTRSVSFHQAIHELAPRADGRISKPVPNA